jgi:hypothetical protein
LTWEDSTGVSKRIFFILTLLIFLCGMGQADSIRTTVIFKGRSAAGKMLAQPIFPPRLILERVSGNGEPAKGTTAQCKAYLQVIQVVNGGIAHAMILDCGESTWMVVGLMLDPPRD